MNNRLIRHRRTHAYTVHSYTKCVSAAAIAVEFDFAFDQEFKSVVQFSFIRLLKQRTIVMIRVF